MYADDLVIFSPSSIGLRAMITVCEEYAVSHDMLFNHKKSVILICRSKYMKNVYPVFTLNGKLIDESDTVRYLGHTSKIPVRWPDQCYGFTLSLIFKYCGGIELY